MDRKQGGVVLDPDETTDIYEGVISDETLYDPEYWQFFTGRGEVDGPVSWGF